MSIPPDAFSERDSDNAPPPTDEARRSSRRLITVILGIAGLIGLLICVALGMMFMIPDLFGFGGAQYTGINDPSAADAPTEVPYDTTGYTTTASGLHYLILEEGDGARPQTGDRVTVAYRGTFTNGTEFDSGTIPFVLGTGAVIAGWDEGIALLNEGSKAILVLPSDLAYGPFGSGPIPPNATLIFEVELIEVEQQ